MTEIKVDNIVDVAGTGKPNFPVAPTHSTGSALSTLNTYQYDTTTRVVTVVDDNGTNKFAIDGVTAPTITLLRGVTYTFDVSDSSVSTHPLAFKNAGTSYTTGVTSSGTAGTTGATVTFAVASDAPLTGLTYYCTTHGDGMGSSVTTSDPKNGAMLWDGTNVNFYVDSEFKAIGTSDSGGSSGSFPSDFDISNLSYDSVTTGSLSGASYGSALSDPGVYEFNNDGTKVYIIDWNNTPEYIHEYPLSTAYDITTVGSVTHSLDVSARGGSPFGLAFKPDGTKMYMGDSTNDDIFQYSLSTAWDLSTATYDNKFGSTETAGSVAFKIKSDGTKLIGLESTLDSLHGYSMSTPWDISTLSYDSERICFNSAQSTGPTLPLIADLFTSALGLTINPAGDKIFITHYSPSADRGTIYQIDLSTAWDITTASYNNKSFDMSSQETDMIHFEFNGDFTKIIAIGRQTNGLFQYSYNSGSSSSGGGGSATNSGDRGVFFGGTSTAVVNVIEYVDITTPGNAQDFGDLTETTRRAGACSNGTRGLRMGNVANPATVIDYVTIATPGNAQDFGDLSVGRYYCASFSDGTYGFTVGGSNASGYLVDTIDYVTIATTGNATDFGNTTEISDRLSALADSTRGVYSLGSTDASGLVNNLDYITTATPGNATDFGDMTQASTTRATGADATRGIFAQGYTGSTSTNTIEYITIQTTGNATDFGDATTVANRPAGCANSTRMLMAGGNGNAPNYTKWDIIAYITIQTTGNATDFGDLSEGKVDMGAFSGAAS